MPFFSICIPAYQPDEEYFVQCLRSIADQDFCDYEVVILDDGSPEPIDISSFISLSGLSFDRVVFNRAENVGAYKARCKLLGMAQGDVILAVDSDDALIGHDVLRSIYECFCSSDVDMVCYNATRDTKSLSPLFDYSMFSCADSYAVDAFEYKKRFASTYDFNSLWTKAVRRVLVQDPDIGCPRVQMADDRLLSLDLISNVQTVAFINRPLYFYRVAQGSITSLGYRPESYKQVCYVEQRVLSRIDEFGFDEKLWQQSFLDVSVNALLGVGYNLSLTRSEKIAGYSSMTSQLMFQHALKGLHDYSGDITKKIFLTSVAQGHYGFALVMSNIRSLAGHLKRSICL